MKTLRGACRLRACSAAFVAVAAFGLFVAWSLGQFVDPGLGLGFEWMTYLPASLVALGCGLAAWWYRPSRRPARWLLIGLAIVALVVSLVRDHRWSRAIVDPPPKAWTILHWNVCRGWFLDSIAAEVHARAPDLFVLAEFPEPKDLAEVEPSLLGATRLWRAENLVFGCRVGHLVPVPVETIEHGRIYAVDWTVDGRRIRVCAVDVNGSPFYSRRSSLCDIAARVRKLRQDLLVGDFNTPRDCVWLEALEPELANAYEAAGAGWSATWPLPLPVLAIDHLFFGARVLPVEYRLFSAVCSDHRGQEFDFALRTAFESVR